MRKRTITLWAFSLSLAVVAPATDRAIEQDEQQQDTAQDISKQMMPLADIALNADNYATWRDHIQPDLSELAWEDIPWRTTFKDGITAADAAGKPLLLWTMNGHPLGCT